MGLRIDGKLIKTEQSYAAGLTSFEDSKRKKVDFTDLETLEKDLKHRIESTKDSVMYAYISVLGIFASIVTFLLVEVQILRVICDVDRMVGFSFIIAAILMLFVLTLHYIVNGQKENTNLSLIGVIGSLIFFLFILGIIFVSFAKDEYVCKITNLESTLDELLQRNQVSEIELTDRVKKIEDKVYNAQ